MFRWVKQDETTRRTMRWLLDPRTLADSAAEVQMDFAYDAVSLGTRTWVPPRWMCWPLAVTRRVELLFAITQCLVVGHDLVDEGHAGPDSGCIDLSCKRCGMTYPRIVLY